MGLLEQPRYEDYDIAYLHVNPFAHLGNGFSTKEFDGSDLSYYLGTESAPGGMLPRKMNGTYDELGKSEVHVNDTANALEEEDICVNRRLD